jgi:hypothetical protein
VVGAVVKVWSNLEPEDEMKTAPLVITVMTFAAAGPIAAQAAPSDAGPTVLVSLATGLSAGSPELGGQASLSVSRRGTDVIVRIAENSDLTFFGGGETVRDIAVLLGRRASGRRGWTRAAAGIGHVRRAVDVEVHCPFFCIYEEAVTTGAGLALQLDALWAPSRAFGLGVGALANLNGQQTLGALTFSIHMGMLR